MSEGGWAMVSELTVDDEGVDELEAAFAARRREVDSVPGFLHLEVWRDSKVAGRYLMVSWWETREAFTTWFRSDAHRRSHAHVPTTGSPRPVHFDRYEVIAR